MTNEITNEIKWQPKNKEATHMARFAASVGLEADYQTLWRWSVTHTEKFWNEVWNFCGVIGDKGEKVFSSATIFQDSRFFEDSKINFAENLLRRRDDETAIIFKGEDKIEREITTRALYDAVSQVRQALIAEGVTKGDRVAGLLPNIVETIVAMLAATSLGAIWSSASPDFGVEGVLDRFGQIEPKILFAVDGYYYNGKVVDCRAKVIEVSKKLPTLKKTILVRYVIKESLKSFTPFDDFKDRFSPQEIIFERFSFNHPLYIMFSSGTTGIPKCIVHGAGGTLLQHLKEHQLHCDIQKNDRVFYFTTCGWMMWNWLVSALASNATLVLYDGSPFLSKGKILIDMAKKYGVTFFGASAKYIDALKTLKVKAEGIDSVRMITSTGSPLSHEGFDYVYEALFPKAQLASISGGTDIVSCFVLGNPLSAVRRGEIQGAGLGMDVDVFDEEANPIKEGKGELVCKKPFPSMPIGFWNDADGSKYKKAYFERFENVWCHGDWCEWTVHGGMIIHGRSDATLNPGGVRIGTAEIYRIVEQIEGIKESIAIGQSWQGDVRVVLFVVMNDSALLTEGLIKQIKENIRDQASPRHVPAKIITVADIPRTKSGKITELAVRDVVEGRVVKNVEALANPEALDLYKNLKELTA